MHSRGLGGVLFYLLYGRDPYASSHIDGFLDVSLVFARQSQRYLLALGSGEIDAALHGETREARWRWLTTIGF